MRKRKGKDGDRKRIEKRKKVEGKEYDKEKA